MSRLLLVNGLPGVGKSSLARRFVEDHPLSLLLDIDELRAQLGCWQADPLAAGVRARQLALAMAQAQLAAGGEVVIPQYLGRIDFVERLAALAAQASASFVELVLTMDPAEAERRFSQRSQQSTEPSHLAAAWLQEQAGAPSFEAMQQRLDSVVAARPATRLVAVAASEQETYQALVQTLDG